MGRYGVFIKGETEWNLLNAELYALAICLNLYTMSDNCEVATEPSPLLPSKSKRRSINKPKFGEWNGVMCANGTSFDDAPADLSLGYVEILKKGTGLATDRL
ncbi:hypothetical protein B0T10DRAFT_569419 [Thelonectria olida]|uniref:Uncharacterized protein n=1 Tax=Thelonectria olida TaxID=1576542 RepID=A0A9P9AJ42_9HYPO|nr:hypothetical protein B0T10DRAFT_569419 [Thelonectria olida]